MFLHQAIALHSNCLSSYLVQNLYMYYCYFFFFSKEPAKAIVIFWVYLYQYRTDVESYFPWFYINSHFCLVFTLKRYLYQYRREERINLHGISWFFFGWRNIIRVWQYEILVEYTSLKYLFSNCYINQYLLTWAPL